MIEPLGIIAGRGQLPVNVAKSLSSQGVSVYIVRINGMANPNLKPYPGTDLNLGQIGSGMQALRSAKCENIIFAGYIKRPNLHSLDFDDTGMALLPKVLAAASKGDDAIMRTFIDAFQEAGFTVLGAEEAYADLLCDEGTLTQSSPGVAASADLKRAFHIAGLIGQEDIGQACIVCDGLVLTVEAQEGTDHMLSRIVELPSAIRGTPESPRGVLVKRAKPGQERRVDLPVIGPDTIRLAQKAHLVGIGLEAGASLIVDRVETLRLAEEAGLFIVGLKATDPATS